MGLFGKSKKPKNKVYSLGEAMEFIKIPENMEKYATIAIDAENPLAGYKIVEKHVVDNQIQVHKKQFRDDISNNGAYRNIGILSQPKNNISNINTKKSNENEWLR